MHPGYRILRCSWPRPITVHHRRWVSGPDWEAPPLPWLPRPQLLELEHELYAAFDWREILRGVPGSGGPDFSVSMRGFHLVFEVEVTISGQLEFWCDDGCVIRRNGVVVHHDPDAHPLQRAELAVAAGDRLEIAHWQLDGEWLWAGRVRTPDSRTGHGADWLWEQRQAIAARVESGSGPPLKLYTHGRHPLRVALGIYSLIANGYAPSRVLLFGEHQWRPKHRRILVSLLPFAEIVHTMEVLQHVERAGGKLLAERAWRRWWVFKALLALLYPPFESCVLDDDVFILDDMSDALEAFREHHLVFAADMDYRATYQETWQPAFDGLEVRTTAHFNAGLYLLRGRRDVRDIGRIASVVPAGTNPLAWEQGLIASLYADEPVRMLPPQRYFYPVFDGLPGGILGYDYRTNPCGFASIHFGGIGHKPGDADALRLAPAVLARRPAAAVAPLPATTTSRVVPASLPSAGSPSKMPEGALDMPLLLPGPDAPRLFAVDGGGKLWMKRDEWRCLGGELAPLDGLGGAAVGPEWRVYARGADGRLWRLAGAGEKVGPWTALGGDVRRITAVMVEDIPHVFACDREGVVWHLEDTPGEPRWTSLGGKATRLAATATAEGGIALFARGQDGAARWRYRSSRYSGWSDWESLGGDLPATGRMAAVTRPDGRMELIATASARVPFRRVQLEPGGSWQPWEALGGGATELAALPCPAGSPQLFVRGGDGALWWCRPGNKPGELAIWRSPGGEIGRLAAAETPDGRAVVAATWPDGSLRIIERRAGGEWSAWRNETPWIEPSASGATLRSRFQVEWSDPVTDGTWCGPGSTESATANVRRALPALLRGLGVRTLNDAGCGDCSWISRVDLSGIDYLGYDLRDWPGRPDLPFRRADVVHDRLRPCDLILCREVLFHLPNALVMKALENFAQSGRYLLTTSMRGGPGDNRRRHRWEGPGDAGYSPLDLEAPPFNLPPPLLTIPEPAHSNRFLGLWDLRELALQWTSE